MTAAREVWAMLELVDRQLVDRDGVSAGKVDDLLFRDPTDDQPLPVLTDVLTGAAALAQRFNDGLARELERARRLEVPEPDPGPARVPMQAVRDLGTAVQLNVRRSELDIALVDRWLARTVLSHIPGSGTRKKPSSR